MVVGQGTSALILQTDAGAGVGGSMQRIHGFCQTSDLSGAFGSQYSAASDGVWSTAAVIPDGQGNATATATRLNSGVISKVACTGSIGINADCSATLTLTSLVDCSMVSFSGMVSSDESQIFSEKGRIHPDEPRDVLGGGRLYLRHEKPQARNDCG